MAKRMKRTPRRIKKAIDTLRQEFDAQFASMQTPAAGRAMKNAFNASPKQLGKAAVAAARKRGY